MQDIFDLKRNINDYSSTNSSISFFYNESNISKRNVFDKLIIFKQFFFEFDKIFHRFSKQKLNFKASKGKRISKYNPD